MKCKRHPQEQGGGVCASCLRERLLALQAVQNGTLPERQRRNSPPPILFPRSASPLASHRRSVDSDAASDASDSDPRRRRGRRFNQTPQIGDRPSDEGKSHRCQRSHMFSFLFHHYHHSDESEAPAPNSWFSSFIHGRRNKNKKKSRTVSSPPPVRTMKSYAVSDRGMSPVRGEETDDNGSESGYSTEPSAMWRRPTPARRASVERHRRNGGAFVGFTVGQSPLVRPEPSFRRSQPPDPGFSGELRSKANPVNINRHVSSAGVSFGPNRSRKLADRGRFR